MPFGFADQFSVQPPMGWEKPNPWLKSNDESWKFDNDKKLLFAKHLVDKTPFNAACEVFENTSHALWASSNWLNDPIVKAARDAVEAVTAKLLDKDSLSLKLLKFAEEKDITQRFYVVEAKDRLAALKLYAEIQGYIGKVDIDASTKTFNNNTMKIVFVKPDIKEELKTIDVSPDEDQSETFALPPNIKLVSSGR